VLQVLTIKILETDGATNPGKTPKAKITLSDGIAYILAIVVEASWDKFVQAPSQFDVIEVKKFSMVEVKGKKLMMLRDPISIVAENLNKLGNPKDLGEIMANSAGFELDREVEIPRVHEEAIESVHLPSQSIAETVSTKPLAMMHPSVQSS